MEIINEEEKDAIVESFNIGLGVAAASLSEMLSKEIALSVPNFEVICKAEIKADNIKLPYGKVTGVQELFSGDFSGNALLLFQQEKSLELVRLLLQEEISLEDLTEMEEEALVEIGNIILNACIGSIADILSTEIVSEIPTAVKGCYRDIVLERSHDTNTEYLMQLQMDFSIIEVNISGHIAFMMDLISLDNFRKSLGTAFGINAA